MSEYTFKTIYQGIEKGYISIGLPKKGITFHSVTDLDAAEAYMLAMAANDHVYHSWNVVGDVPQNGRGKSADFVAMPGILFDWDVKSDDPNVHSRNDELPGSLDEILAILDKADIPHPTAIVHSGNGYYGRYHFEAPYLIANDNDREAASALSKGMHARVASAFRDAGYHIDNVSDLPRITRHPGTYNHKTTPPKPVKLVSCNFEKRYEIAELAALVVNDPPKMVPVRYSTTRRSTATTDEKKPDFDAVVAGCSYVREGVENAASTSEPHWYAVGTIAERCEDGVAIFHELSSADPRYDEGETAGKLGRANGPRTCKSIAADWYDGCKNCALYGGAVSTPLQLGTRSPMIAKLMSEYVFVVKQRQYIHLPSGARLLDTQFSDKFRAFTGKETPHSLLNVDKFTRKVDTIDYLPGALDKFVQQDGETKLNTWTPSDLDSDAGDCALILQHFEYLVPDEKERDHLLDMLAHAVQNPSEKIRHAAIIMGGQGTGKSFLGKLLTKLFGQHNATTLTGEEVLSQWTEKLGNVQVMVWEESGVGGQLEAYERMKPWITEEVQIVHQKHIVSYNARTPRLIFGFTNQQVPIRISADDRRFFIIKSPAEPKGADYYKMLFSQGVAQASAFLWMLQHRDISHFSASAPPPMTEAKRELIEDSQPALIREIKSMMLEQEFPFGGDVFTRDQLLDALRHRVSHRANLSGSALSAAMQQLGFLNLGQQRMGEVGRPRLWAWRNLEQWQAATNGELRQAFFSNVKPMIR